MPMVSSKKKGCTSENSHRYSNSRGYIEMKKLAMKSTGNFKYCNKRKNLERDIEQPSYKVLYPGHRSTSTGRYAFRRDKDPRLGSAKRAMDHFYKTHGLDYDGLSEEDENDDGEDDEEIMSKTVVVRGDIQSHSNKDNDQFLWKLTDEADFHKKQLRNDKNNYKRQVKNEANELKKQDCLCANEAIRFYNEKHSTDYEIVETLGSYFSLYVGYWYHCNFTAKCKSDTGRHSSPKLFFAELKQICDGELDAKYCMILNSPGQSPDIVRGCKMCDNQLWHPVNGFKAGKDRPFSLRVAPHPINFKKKKVSKTGRKDK